MKNGLTLFFRNGPSSVKGWRTEILLQDTRLSIIIKKVGTLYNKNNLKLFSPIQRKKKSWGIMIIWQLYMYI